MLARSLAAAVPALQAATKEAAIHELLLALAPANPGTDWHGVEAAVLRRERSASTGIGDQVAVPHAKWEGDFTLAVGVSREGIEFDAQAGKKVHVIFLLLAPNGRPVDHLKLLAAISRRVSEEGFCERLKSSGSAAAISGIIGTEKGGAD